MGSIIILVPMFLAIWFFFLRPQQRKVRAQQELLANLEVGDEVLTSGGIYGRITDFDEGTVFLEVADGVEMKITRESIGQKIVYAEWDDSADETDDDDVADEVADGETSERDA